MFNTKRRLVKWGKGTQKESQRGKRQGLVINIKTGTSDYNFSG